LPTYWALDPAGALHENVARSVDHDLGHGLVAQKWHDGSEKKLDARLKCPLALIRRLRRAVASGIDRLFGGHRFAP
jgi:hypothetical protein